MKREIEKSSLHCILIRYKSLSLLNSWSEFSGFVGRLHFQFSLLISPHLHQTSPTHNTSDEQPELHFRHSIDFTGFRYHRANACSQHQKQQQIRTRKRVKFKLEIHKRSCAVKMKISFFNQFFSILGGFCVLIKWVESFSPPLLLLHARQKLKCHHNW